MKRLAVTVVGGLFAGLSMAVPPGQSLRVGRSDACGLSVIDPMLSREHFELTPTGGQYLLRDLHSSNGTQLNDRVIGPGERLAVIQHGDSITAGCTIFQVLIDDSLPALGNESATRDVTRSEELMMRETREHRDF